MSYELFLPLKGASIEIEFDTVAQLERKLARLDVPRIERAVAATLRGEAPAKPRAAKKAKRARRKA